MLGKIVSELFSSVLKDAKYRSKGGSESYYDESQLVTAISTKANRLRSYGYVDAPVVVHIETMAVCNAACSFCPYEVMERKGHKMPMALIKKVLADLKDIPPERPLTILPYKVNEPFLDSRIFEICHLINDELPRASIAFISNGSALTAGKIAKLFQLKNVSYLNISLNFCEIEAYESTMKIPFHRTIESLDCLHQKLAEVGWTTPIRISRVSENKKSDVDFLNFVKSRYPLFSVVIVPRNDWLGNVNAAVRETKIPDAPCHRWFDFSICSTGEVAMCCMDGNLEYPKGDVSKQHVRDIYNQPHLLELRRTLPSRRNVKAPCNNCTYLSM